MKTALQIVIENLEKKLKDYNMATDRYTERCATWDCIQIAKKELETEKNNITDAAENGCTFDSPEDYFTYKHGKE